MGWNRACFIFLGTVLLWLCWDQDSMGQVHAANGVDPWDSQESNLDLSLLDQVDLTQIDELLEGEQLSEEVTFSQLVEELIQGEDLDKKWVVEQIWQIFMGQLRVSKGYMIQLILLTAAFALLYNFANVFQQAAVTEISFYLVYMIMLALLLQSFSLMNGILKDSLGTMLDFMRVLLPAFCLVMVVSTGAASALGFYQLTLLLIYLIEVVLLYVVVPAVQIYILLELMNHLTREQLISKLTELLKNAVEWILKFLFTLVIGINVVQGLLTPVIDGFKTTMFARTASMLPGFGNAANAVAEVMVGSGIVIKNGVGVAGMLVILILCAGPLVKVGAMALMYKITAAVIQPIADKRISGCISGMGEGARLFGKIMVTASVMLLLTIAMVTAATTWNR